MTPATGCTDAIRLVLSQVFCKFQDTNEEDDAIGEDEFAAVGENGDDEGGLSMLFPKPWHPWNLPWSQPSAGTFQKP